MSDAGVLIQMKFKEFRNYFRTFGEHSRFKVGVVTAFACAFWLGLFFLFMEGFRFLAQFRDIQNLLIEYLFSLFFLSLTAMLLVSSAIISYSSLFKAQETEFLITNPLAVESVFLYKLAESTVYSSWAFLLLATPLIVAFGVMNGIAWYFCPATLLLFGIYMFIPASAGTILSLLLTRFFPRRKKHAVLVLAVIIVLLLGVIFLRIVHFRGAFQPFSDIWIRKVFGQLDFSRHPLFPSYWLTRAMVGISTAESGEALFYFLVFLSFAVFLVNGGYRIAKRIYRTAWSQANEGRTRRFFSEKEPIYEFISRMLFFLDPGMRTLVMKDLKTFLRNPVQWSQFLIFFGLLCVYFLNLRSLAYDVRAPHWRMLIAFLNLAATGLTLATFTSRFVFPQISLEGRKFWALGMMPIDRKSILFAKFIFSFGSLLVVSEALVLMSDLMLKMDSEMVLIHMVVVFEIGLGLAGMAVGLGALYPSFKEDNPSKIISTFGGTLNLVLSLVFVFIMIVPVAVTCHAYYGTHAVGYDVFSRTVTMVLWGAVSVGIAGAGIPILLGIRAFRRMEL